MAPELAARVEASVGGTRGRPIDARRARWGPALTAAVRVGVSVALVALVVSVVLLRRRDRRDLERSRAALLATVRAASASLTLEDERSGVRVQAWLTRSAGAYESDYVAEELRVAGALTATLARPAVYVRGAIEQLATPAGTEAAALASVKDPFLYCLLDPPGARTEKAMLSKVYDAYSAGAEARTATVRRLREAQVGLPFLSELWADTVRAAGGQGELDVLREQFEKAPIAAATRAAKAGLLVYAMDEPGEATGPTELDGERAHPVRVGLVELATAKVLLRLRRRVDPSWISAAKRPLYAGALDGCALAFDVREWVGR